MNMLRKEDGAAPDGGRFINGGEGPTFQPFDIGHDTYTALIEPETAFWSLVKKDKLADTLAGGTLLDAFFEKQQELQQEMDMLRFNLKPSAVYFNPTERCNLNCTYCYIPDKMRKYGKHMAEERLIEALTRLKDYFADTVPEGRLPQIIFHGAEPMLTREAMFKGIEKFRDDFRFGVQTNATLLDDEAISFLKQNKCSIGLSLDAPDAETSDKTRYMWNGRGVFDAVAGAMKRLQGYDGWSVLCTMSTANQDQLVDMVEFFHAHGAPACMLNVLRCTLPGARPLQQDDFYMAERFIEALERSNELYHETGRKMVVANFANILISLIAPTARRLMCDISPCGGGRSFFALATNGDMFPCSEFIGVPEFNGGNLFTDSIPDVLDTPQFRKVTERKVEDIKDCKSCAIRHFCGSPCPSEANEMNGGMDQKGAFCSFYVEQTRYALRLLADGRQDEFLWEGWDDDTVPIFDIG